VISRQQSDGDAGRKRESVLAEARVIEHRIRRAVGGRFVLEQCCATIGNSSQRWLGVHMVYRRNDAGTAGWHEPPYTEEEEFEFYQRISRGMASGQATIYRGSKKAAKPPKKKGEDGLS
jgi:hypothetical protein